MKGVFLSIIALFATLSVAAQAKDLKNVNLDALINETQFTSDDPDAMEMIWWLPEVFWKTSFMQDPNISEADLNELHNVLRGYDIFAVLKGKIGYFGGVDYINEAQLEEIFSVSLNNKGLKPMKEEAIPSDLLNLISIMKPMMINMMGPMGENMHFFVTTNNGDSIDPFGKDAVELGLGKFKINIELPLGSLLVEKKCPEDEKLWTGKFFYCPIHGKELVSN